MSGNITAISYVNNKGEIKSEFYNEIQKNYGFGDNQKRCGTQLHTLLEHKLLR